VTPPGLLPWERLLWSSRPWRFSRLLAGERYLLTDFRLLHITRAVTSELALDDVGDVHRTQSPAERILGISTIAVHPAAGGDPLTLTAVRRGAQLAALLELIAGDPRAPRDADAVRSALAWEPRHPALDLRGALAGFVGVLVAIVAVAIGLHGTTAAVSFAPDDALAPNGEKRSEAEIIRFMETDVMPWARVTFARLKGGADRVTCETCHGAHPAARGWRMPAVAALPQPDVRDRGWEIYQTKIDAQMRNAIYGYLAESDNQTKAAYMREIVVPGMSRLLHRPSYDFTQSYEFNRARSALGCYHCHQVQ
jgi:cytochrome c553